MHCQVSTPIRLPPPLRGRIGEGGMLRTPTGVMWHVRSALNHLEEA
ncbi:hypothetical protein FBZ94_103261 [Bradyrhizobium sacchari]|uniref:Uncharacterized protein n=1 Tax=Bradyrhizobium sacchari TaxID=1399419 RepID=A0A560IUC3_9BRAD|nr:hypothetical protein FBZ94_103261 [Bradyrhizobium sacchari]TWB76504.1 hypothetical protein FBZ95_104689 [Bradyrhizobium sacchari]